MTDFSNSLNEDQLTLQKWVHDFAETWCARRPTSGTSGRRRHGRSSRRRPGSGCTRSTSWPACSPTRPASRCPLVMEEMAWGDAGIGLAIFGTTLGVAGIFGNGTPEQIAEWVPAVLRHAGKDRALAAFCVSEPDAGSDVSSMRTRAVYDEATDEWVLNGTKTWITNGGIADIHVVVASVDPDLKAPGPGQLHRAPRDQGSVAWARSSRRWASGPRIPPRWSSTTSAIPGRLLLGGKEKLDERLARARAGPTTASAPRPPCRHSRRPDPRSPPRPSGSPGPRTSTPSSTPRSASSSGGRSSRTRPSPSSWPRCGCSPTPPACWCGTPPGGA